MRKILAPLFLLITFFLLMFSNAYAVPNLISYQGVLNDSGGTPVNSTVSMTFKIYDVDTGGTALWNETQSVQVSNGVFNVQLGSVQSLTPSVFQIDYLYLGLTVGADPEMLPRQQITTGAYSHRSALSDVATQVAQPITPVGSIVAWAKHFKSIEKYQDINTYGAHSWDGLQAWRVGFSFTGQDLINAGLSEGESFQFYVWTRKVRLDGTIGNANFVLFMNPSTTVPNAVVSGTSLGSYNSTYTTFVKRLFTVAPSVSWNFSTDFVAAYYRDGHNSSHDYYSQFHTFTVLTNDALLPEGWVECNGQILNDPDSIYNGLTIPDLNVTSKFLRGSYSTGDTGGSSFSSSVQGTLGSNAIYGPSSSQSTNLPPYYNVMWIMKIK